MSCCSKFASCPGNNLMSLPCPLCTLIDRLPYHGKLVGRLPMVSGPRGVVPMSGGFPEPVCHVGNTKRETPGFPV